MTGFINDTLGGSSASSFDPFVASFHDSSGAQQWITQFGTSNLDQGINLAPANSGNVSLTGYTQDSPVVYPLKGRGVSLFKKWDAPIFPDGSPQLATGGAPTSIF